MVKKRLFLILFVFSLCIFFNVKYFYAGDNENNNKDLSYLSGLNDTLKIDKDGGLLFLFSSEVIDYRHDGYMICLFSNLEVRQGFKGDIYSFFSNVSIVGGNGYDGIVNSVSSKIAISNDLLSENISIRGISFSDIFMGESQNISYTFYTNEVPPTVFKIIVAIFNVSICILLYLIKKSFMEQGSVLLNEEPIEVIKNGIISYCILLGIVVIMFLTIFLLPLAIIMAMATYLFMLIGETALAVYIGFFITNSIQIKNNYGYKISIYDVYALNPFLCMIIGVFTIEALKLVPIIGMPLSYLFLPIITIGILLTAISNGFVKKIFYITPYYENNNKKVFDIDEIRDIILK